MKNDVFIKNGIAIPDHELEITASRSGGPGGQHTQKTSTRITIRWNIKNTVALNDEQKERVLQKLQSQLTADGDLIVHNSQSRSQEQNRKMALANLAQIIRKAIVIPKKRKPTQISKAIKEVRLQEKKQRSSIKKMRRKKIEYD